MRCRKCGTLGYSRKTLIPKWRCRSGGCCFEWDDTPPSSEELVEELRLEADRRESELRREQEGRQRERQLRLEEEERRRNDQAELEAIRLESSRRQRQVFDETERQRIKENNKRRGAQLALFGFIAGAAIGRALTDSFGGALIVAILLGAVAYYLGENWDDLRS
mgnify:CR=1